MLKLFPPLLAREVWLGRDFPLVSCVPSIQGTESARLISMRCSSPLSYSQPSLSPCTFSPSSWICHDARFADLMPFFLVLTFFFPPHCIFLLLSHHPTLLVGSGCRNKIPQTGCLNRNLFSHCSRGLESKVKVSVGLVSPEASLLGLLVASLPLCSCGLSSVLERPCCVLVGPCFLFL